jgi:hypothetical protein
MVKNVKIDEKAHRELRIKAAELECKISDLCSILIGKALETLTQDELKTLLVAYQDSCKDRN